MNKRAVGTEYEDKAADFLISRNVLIKERNFRFHKLGEIDIIGYDDGYLVFFEVKYRKNAAKGRAEEAVDVRKASVISRVSDAYRMLKHISQDVAMRFDVIAINGDEINWIKNAFPYMGH